MDVTLETSRLRLRPLAENDIPALVANLNDWDVVKYLTRVPQPCTEEDAQGWVASRPTPVPTLAHFAIELPDEGMVGSVAIESELCYWLARSHHGKGLMTEACVALLDWHFSSVPDDTIRSGAHRGNDASLNVQRKLGFVETSTSMRFARPHNREIEHVETTLTFPAYRDARARL